MNEKFTLLTAITIAFILTVGGVIAVNKLNAGKADRQKTKRQHVLEQERKYKVCIRQAKQAYLSIWDKECLSRGLRRSCRLPMKIADSKGKVWETNKANCIKIYKDY